MTWSRYRTISRRGWLAAFANSSNNADAKLRSTMLADGVYSGDLGQC
jgi:hypothetical protein